MPIGECPRGLSYFLDSDSTTADTYFDEYPSLRSSRTPDAPFGVVKGLALLEYLGAGGFAHVLLARDLSLANGFAENPYRIVKMMRRSLAQSESQRLLFQKEGQRGLEINRDGRIPNLPQYLSVLQFDADGFPVPLIVLAARAPRGYDPATDESLTSLQGRSLAQVLHLLRHSPDGKPRHVRFRESAAIAVIQQAAQAVQALHLADPPLVHNDLQPGNLLLSPVFCEMLGHAAIYDGDPSPDTVDDIDTFFNHFAHSVCPDGVMVLDLGLTAVAGQPLQLAAGSEGTLFRPDQDVGIPEYMAPELFSALAVLAKKADNSSLRATTVVGHGRSEIPCDQRSDVYSLGALLFELLTGEPPFVGSRSTIPLLQQKYDPFVPPALVPCISVTTRQICLSALSRERHFRRYSHAGDMVADLNMVCSSESTRDTPNSPDYLDAASTRTQGHSSSPVHARCKRPLLAKPLSTGELLRRYWLRHPSVVILVMMIALAVLLAGGFGITYYRAGEIDRARQVAESEKTKAEQLKQVADSRRDEADKLRVVEQKLREEADASRNEADRRRTEAEQLKTVADTERDRADSLRKAEEQQRKKAETLESIAYRNRYASDIGRSHRAWREGDTRTARQLLESHVPQIDAKSDLRDFEWYYLQDKFHSEASVFNGHHAAVTACAVHPSDNLVATADASGVIRFRDANTNEELFLLQGTASVIHDVAFNPTGTLFASASADGTVTIWDFDNRKALKALHGHSTEVRCLEFSPDGRFLVSGELTLNQSRGQSQNFSSLIWAVDDWDSKPRKLQQQSGIWDIAYSSDGQSIATAGNDGLVRIWNGPESSLPVEIRAHKGAATAVLFVPSDKSVLSAGTDGAIQRWRADGTKDAQILYESDGEIVTCEVAIMSLAISRDAKKLISSGNAPWVSVWDLVGQRRLTRLIGHSKPVFDVRFTNDEERVVTASADFTSRLWDMSPNDIRRTESHPLAGVSFLPGDDRVIRVLENGVGVVEDVRNPANSKTWNAGLSPLIAYAHDPLSSRIAISNGKSVRVCDAENGRLLNEINGHRNVIRGLAFSGKSNRLATASWDGTVKVWDLETSNVIGTFSKHGGNRVNAVAFSPDGDVVASAGDDFDVVLWDVGRRKEIARFSGHPAQMQTVSFSPDGRFLASGCGDGTVLIWHITDKNVAHTLRGHASAVFSLAYNSTGRRLATGGMDNTVRVWDCEAGQELLTLQGHSRPVMGINFNRDTTLLASGGMDGTLRLWKSPRSIESMKSHHDRVWRVKSCRDGRIIASCGLDSDPTVRVFDASTGKTVCTYNGHRTGVMALSIDGKRERIASGSKDGEVRVWKPGNAEDVFVIKAHKAEVLSVSLGSENEMLVTAGNDRTIGIWDSTTGVLKHRLQDPSFFSRAAYLSAVCNPAGTIVAAGGMGQKVMIWDIATGRLVREIDQREKSISEVSFSRDGSKLIVAGADGLVRVWDVMTWEPRATLSVSPFAISAMSLSPGGDHVGLLVQGRFGQGAPVGQVQLWNWSSRDRRVQYGPVEARQLYGMCFGGSDNRIITSSADGELQFWELQKSQR